MLRSERPSPAYPVRRIRETVTVTLALLIAGYLLLYSIEPSRRFAERHLVKLNDWSPTVLLAMLLVLAIFAVHGLGRQLRATHTALTARQDDGTASHLAEVLNNLRTVSARGRRRDRRLEVLGLTMDTTWPQLAAWLTSHNPPTHWTITLYCLDPGFISGSADLPPDWATEATRTRQSVQALLTGEAAALERRRVTVELRSYACLPVVHGFRFGDGDLFISYTQWSEAGETRPFDFYERITPYDTSARANHYRDLFDNWLGRVARRTDRTAAVPEDPG